MFSRAQLVSAYRGMAGNLARAGVPTGISTAMDYTQQVIASGVAGQ
jgi:hypothetical protein